MEKDNLDVMLENYIDDIRRGSDPDSIKDGAGALYSEGIGEAGLIRIIENELGKEKKDEVAEVLAGGEDASSEPVSGIGGWLALFCVILVFISPARSAFALFRTMEATGIASTEDLITFGFVAGMSVFSILSGVALLMRKSYAVKLAKSYLLTTLVVSFIVPVSLLLMFDMPEEYRDSILSNKFSTLVSPVMFFLIWFGYLSTSSRVKNTFQK